MLLPCLAGKTLGKNMLVKHILLPDIYRIYHRSFNEFTMILCLTTIPKVVINALCFKIKLNESRNFPSFGIIILYFMLRLRPSFSPLTGFKMLWSVNLRVVSCDTDRLLASFSPIFFLSVPCISIACVEFSSRLDFSLFRIVFCVIGCCDTNDNHSEVASKSDDYIWLKVSDAVLLFRY